MIERLNGAHDELLSAITQCVVDALHPARVILFGSRARGDARPDSDYDVVVEISHTAADAVRVGARAREAIANTVRDVSVDVILRQPGQIESRRDDPGYMDWDIAREGVILYPPGDAGWPPRTSQPDRVRETPASVNEWLARAEEDCRAVRNILSAGADASWTAVAFHSQQFAEKYLKALLVRTGVRPPKSHDLTEMLAVARKHGLALPDIDEACAALKEFAVGVRYAEAIPILTEAKAKNAWAAAQAICDAIDFAVSPRTGSESASMPAISK